MTGTSTLFGTIASAAVPTASGVDTFLRIDGIPGDATDDHHRDEVPVLDWTFGLAAARGAPGGGGPATGRADPKELVVVARTGKASPALIQAVSTQRRVGAARLTVHRGGRDPFDILVIDLDEVRVTRYDAAAHPVNAVPLDVVRLAYAKLTVTTRVQGPGGAAGSPSTVTIDFGGRGR